ncbi:MAG: prepilin-type N-terminal cleavage/methylation domain-containing protein [Verrucomicrobiae bacterium]|nr:prepilin-type N-terminal cleavage/methylation domain-containing protein [Verrucomicrobiae bacterium]
MKIKSIDKIRRRAFTLVELLVTVAILGLLASLLMPALSAVREKSRQIKCVNNLKQVGLACSMYAQENNGILFIHLLNAPAETYLPTLFKQKGYISNTSVCFCPSCPVGGTFSQTYTYGIRNYRTTDPYIFYDGANFASGSSYLRFYDPPNPADFYLFTDSVYGPAHVAAGKQRHVTLTVPTNAEGGVHMRHNGVANVLFLDGHVEACDAVRLKAVGFTGGFDKNLTLVTY